VIEALAILDRPAHFHLAQQISGRSEEETVEGLELGVRWLFLRDDRRRPGQIHFSHELMRRAVAEQISPLRRRLLHRRAAAALTQAGAEPAILAFHWGAAGEHASEARCAAEAGSAAAALYANDEAVAQFRRALAIAPSSTVWRRLGDVHMRVGRWEAAENAFNESRDLALAAGTERDLARAHLALGKLHVARADYEIARHYLLTAETALAGDADDPALAETFNNLAIIAYRQGDYAAALDHYRAAARIDQALDDRQGMVIRLGNIGLIHLNQGRLDDAHELLTESLRLARRLDHQEYVANRLGNLGIVASLRGDYAGALRLYEKAIAIDEPLGNTPALARHLGNMGLDLYRLGDFAAAIDHWLRALALERTMGNRGGEARHLGNLGSAVQDLGHFQQAETYLALALALDLAARHLDALARHASSLATMYLRRRMPAAAVRWLAPALALARHLDDHARLAQNLVTAARLAREAGRLDAARTHVEACLALAPPAGSEEDLLAAAVLDIELRAAPGQLETAAAVAALRALLPAHATPAAQALIHDAIGRLDPGGAGPNEAARLYAAAHEAFPHVFYRQRHSALTGASLPAPSLPPPPADLPPPRDLAELHQALADLVKSLPEK
jgi:tetratricopeptide (TPR) repeat protein